ncbi:MAG TPA: ATP-binding cassette domain-containing protein [Acidimicrobiales bacterium]|nr:ATP-binding cassette domain-containing protein [Acidimicrobiales bacterium]
MTQFLTLLVGGIVAGGLYSLLATGLTLTYSTSGIFNFGHGAIAFTSAFLYYQLHTGQHWPILPAAAVAILVFAPLLGFILDKLIFHPLADADEVTKIIASVGVLIALPAIAYFVVQILVNDVHLSIPTGAQLFLPPGVGPTPPDHFSIGGGATVSSDQLIVLGSAVVAALLLWLLLRHTQTGRRIRATVDRRNLAAMRGVDPARSSSMGWMIGAFLAGLVGVVGAPVFNNLSAGTYTLILFISAAAAVAGRLRSIPIAFVAGIALGVLQNLVGGYASFAQSIPGFSSAVPGVAMLAILIVLGRDKFRIAGSAVVQRVQVDHTRDLPPWRRAAPWAVATVLLVIYVVWIGSEFWVGVVTEGLAFGLIFLSFTVVTGLGGMVSLAQAGFVTLSSLLFGVLLADGLPMFPAILLAIAASAVCGVLVALPALRVNGLSLALATFAVALVGDAVLFQWQNMAGPSNQGWKIPRPSIGPVHLSNMPTLAIFLLVIVFLVSLLVRNIGRSPTGRAVVAVRASEAAAISSGISPLRTKLALFGISAAIAGFGGVMLSIYFGGATNGATPATSGLIWLATVVLFGIRRPAGAIVAGLITALSPAIINGGFHFSFLPSFLSWNGTKSQWIPQILFGLGAIQMARYPQGSFALFAEGRYERRQKRKAAQAAKAATAAQAATAAAAAAPSSPAVAGAGGGGVPAAAALGDRAARTVVPLPAPPSVSGPVPDDAVLVLRDIDAGYGDVEVLHGVTLALARGSVVALVGANGAGKSTLCSVICGQVRQQGGTVTFAGRDISNSPTYRRARNGVVVAPESRGIFPGLTVTENLGVWLNKDTEVEQVFERFPSLAARRHLAAGNLSGGEQQMLALGAMLVRPPDVLVVDEPTLGLAPMVVRGVLDVIGELRSRGVAIFVVEEKARDVLSVADTVAIMSRGRLTWVGDSADVTSTLMEAAYLGS